ncbi:nitrite/sulfite reductase [Parvularcula sp. LCG005]|uniref:nitrite/sulfite reductase n=1 Tax=Parvularcula sp. LCG005 TaxID=3078805 RepID=UPI002943C9A7|nr:nitrite/sulfite reductase [Parvularcula sp. LCG005]WOI53133.1 nitrite/sulfite reductase [Parvularcula sp. LCG005]
MYQYDAYDKALVQARVDDFRDQVERRLSGALTEDEFKPLRLMNGLYLQLHAYMLRVAIPYGTLSSDQLRVLGSIARDFDKGYGHVTTRQNMQFNWMKLVDVPDILQRLADVEMHAIQTSGNCIRNVTSDPFAGVAADEIEDPRVWAEIIRQWSTFHPEFSFLPRKFKIAISASEEDRAAVQVHDIGLLLTRNDAGDVGFRVLVGGGLGRTPYIGEVIRDFLPKSQLLSYLEAILRVYNVHGRRDNMYKARIKILVNEMGVDKFRAAVEEEWETFRAIGQGGSVDLPEAERARIAAYFEPRELTPDPEGDAVLAAEKAADPHFAAWVRHNVHPHKVEGYAITTISLKPTGLPPGDITDVQMDGLADIADRLSGGELRTTHEQNFVLPSVAKSDLYTLWQALDAIGLGTSNAGLISDIIACPGLDYCNLANTRSIPVANRIQERFADRGREELIGRLNIKISGCINACGHHHVGHIGILGVDKKGEEYYQVTLGGAADSQSSIGEVVGRGLSTEAVVDAVERLVETYLSLRTGEAEAFIDTYRRLGAAPFKEALYEAA